MFRLRPLAAVMAALALLTGTLLFAPFASTQSGQRTLSPTPPVKLAPPSPTPVTTTTGTTPTPRPKLPKTGLDAVPVALVGLALMAAGAALRRPRRPAPRRRW